MKFKSVLLTAVGLLMLFFGSRLNPQSLTLKYDWRQNTLHSSYTITLSYQGTEVRLPTTGKFRFSFSGNEVAVDAVIEFDMSAFQSGIPAVIRRNSEKNEECGDRLQIRNANLYPSGNAAILRVSVHYEKWYCTYMDVPEVRDWSVRMRTVRTSKNRLVEQNGSVVIQFTPEVIEQRSIQVRPRVAKANLDGIAGVLGDLFSIDWRELAQRELDKRIDYSQLQFAIAEGLREYFRIENVAFYAEDRGKLGLRITSKFTVPKVVFTNIVRSIGRNGRR